MVYCLMAIYTINQAKYAIANSIRMKTFRHRDGFFSLLCSVFFHFYQHGQLARIDGFCFKLYSICVLTKHDKNLILTMNVRGWNRQKKQ